MEGRLHIWTLDKLRLLHIYNILRPKIWELRINLNFTFRFKSNLTSHLSPFEVEKLDSHSIDGDVVVEYTATVMKQRRVEKNLYMMMYSSLDVMVARVFVSSHGSESWDGRRETISRECTRFHVTFILWLREHRWNKEVKATKGSIPNQLCDSV